MAKQQKLTAHTRLETGRSAVNKIKQQGLVPAVVYGGKDKPIALSVNAREISTILSHATSEHFLVDLEIADGEPGEICLDERLRLAGLDHLDEDGHAEERVLAGA